MAVQAQNFSGFCSGLAQDVSMENVTGMNNGLFLTAHQQQQQQLYMQGAPSSSRNNSDNSRQLMPVTSLSDDISAQMNYQRWELEMFLISQNEMLKMAVQHQRRQIAMLLKSYEPKFLSLLNQKDREIAKARNRTLELEDLLRGLQDECHGWQKAATENEAVVAQLKSTIAALRTAANNNTAIADDAESCCDNSEERVWRNYYDSESDEERGSKKTSNLICRSCTIGNSSVVMLPCRHLGSCRDCAAFLDACPVCNAEKKSSIEAFF